MTEAKVFFTISWKLWNSGVKSPQHLVIEEVVPSQAEGLLLPQMLAALLIELSFQQVSPLPLAEQLVILPELPSTQTVKFNCLAWPKGPSPLLSSCSLLLTSSCYLPFAVSQVHIWFKAMCPSPASPLPYFLTRIIPTPLFFLFHFS